MNFHIPVPSNQSPVSMATAKTKRPRTATSNIQHPQESGRSKTLTSMFKMNTDIGQHVLKNPGVAQAIVDKADLKQSDVSETRTLVTDDRKPLS